MIAYFNFKLQLEELQLWNWSLCYTKL